MNKKKLNKDINRLIDNPEVKKEVQSTKLWTTLSTIWDAAFTYLAKNKIADGIDKVISTDPNNHKLIELKIMEANKELHSWWFSLNWVLWITSKDFLIETNLDTLSVWHKFEDLNWMSAFVHIDQNGEKFVKINYEMDNWVALSIKADDKWASLSVGIIDYKFKKNM